MTFSATRDRAVCPDRDTLAGGVTLGLVARRTRLVSVHGDVYIRTTLALDGERDAYMSAQMNLHGGNLSTESNRTGESLASHV